GEFPGKAPIGYLNDYRTKKIIADRSRASLVKEAFETYAKGSTTIDGLRSFFASRGVVSKNGKTLCRHLVSKMISNPFYYGHFLYRGEVHEGKHEAIISKDLFDRANEVINKRWKCSPSEMKSVEKPYLGLLTCATCGGAITAEVQKGHT